LPLWEGAKLRNKEIQARSPLILNHPLSVLES